MNVKRQTIIRITAAGIVIASMVPLIRMSVPTITIEVAAEHHDPIHDWVMLSEKKVMPSGSNGTRYVTTAGLGKADIQITGPFIKEVVTSIEIGPFSRKTLKVVTEKTSSEDIIAGTATGDSIEISNLQTFYSQKVIIANVVVDGVAKNDSYPSLFIFDSKDRKWKDVASEYVENRSNFTLDRQVQEYFSELTSD